MKVLFPLFIAAALGVGLFFFRPDFVPAGIAALKPTPVVQPANAVVAKNTGIPRAALRPRADGPLSGQSAAEPVIAPVEPSAVHAPSAVEVQTSPVSPESVRQIAVGMDADEVVRLLGRPALTTLAVERGAVNQAYVYRQARGVPQVMIYLSDGRVRSAPRYDTH